MLHLWIPLLLAPPTSTDLAPIEVHRRAIDLLEAQRDRDGSSWVDAQLDDDPVRLHSPGYDEPTHYEFGIVGPDGGARGYVIASADRTDFPIAHVVDAGPPPSAMLAAEATGEIDRIYRFGHGRYVAEDDAQRLVAQIGEWPAKLSGYADVLSTPAGERYGSYRAIPGEAVKEHHPQPLPDLTWDSWESWEALRAGYADQRRALAPVDRRNAREDWRIEDLRRSSGETLQAGEFRERPLLRRGGATWVVRGAGRDYVRVELGERIDEGDAVLRVFVDEGPLHEVLPVDIEVSYQDGSHETLRLNVTQAIPEHVLGELSPSSKHVLGRWSRLARKALPNCSKAVITTDYDVYLRGDPSGGNAVRGDGAYRDEHTFFRVEDRGAGKIRLRAPNGKYLHVPHGGGHASASVSSPGNDETYRLYVDNRYPGMFGLRTDRGFRLQPLGDGSIQTTGDRAPPVPRYAFDYCQPRETFTKWAGSSFEDTWPKVRRYTQIPAHRAPSTSQCASGCAATAWAMLFGFHDYEASLGLPRWAHLGGFYRKDNDPDGADAVAPNRLFLSTGDRPSGFSRSAHSMHAGAAGMIWEISQDMNDWVLAGCAPNGEKWTVPQIMGKAKQFLDRRLSVGLVHDYDGAFIMTAKGAKNAYAVIKDQRPVVLGIGSADTLHYPLGIGRDNTYYRIWDRAHLRWAPEANHRHFIIHMGHQQVHTDLVPYGTWFAGHVIPPAPPPKTSKPKPSPIPTKKVKPGTPINPKPKQQGPFPWANPKKGPLLPKKG